MPEPAASVRLPASNATSLQSIPAVLTASKAELQVHKNRAQRAESIQPPPVILRIRESPPVRRRVVLPSDTTSSGPVIRTAQ